MAGVVAALQGTPVLARIRQESVVAYVERCRGALARVVGDREHRSDRAGVGVRLGGRARGAVLTSRIDEGDAHETLVRILLASITN